VEHERRLPAAAALGARRGTGPAVAEVAGRRVGVERAGEAAVVGVAGAALEGGRVGGDAPQLAALAAGGDELAQHGALDGRLVVADAGPLLPQPRGERGDAGHASGAGPVDRAAQLRELGGQRLREPEEARE
jgi:hypothetical protein